MLNTTYRTERKFIIDTLEQYRLNDKARKLLHVDVHGGDSGYIVRSLYFDTAMDTDFYDKLAGIETRRKLRLRIYSPHDNFANLEIKQKQGFSQLKRSLRISRDEALKLIDGRCEFLLDYKDDFADECYVLIRKEGYRPKAIVEYDRTAYVAKENKTRITFDKKVRATESSFDLYSDSLILNPVMSADRTILEIKYNTLLLSYFKDIMSAADKSELSVSKYVLALQNSYLTAF